MARRQRSSSFDESSIHADLAKQLHAVHRAMKPLCLRQDEVSEVLTLIRQLVRQSEAQRATWMPEKREASSSKEQARAASSTLTNERLQVFKEMLQELVQGERQYVQNLGTVVTTYLMPIRQGVVKMKTDVMVAIFSNIDIICSIHKDLLVKLEKTIEHFPRFSVGKVLLEVLPSMSVYTQYVNNFSNSIDALDCERKRSKAFNNFLQSNPMGLETLLSVPLNRIPQYQITLEQMFKQLGRFDADYELLGKAIMEMEELQEYVNRSLTQSDNMAAIIAVEKKLIERESLSLRDVNRQFICEAGAIVMNEEKKKKDDNYLFLFSDLLVLSKPQPKGVYKFKAAINLQYASISPISDGDLKNAFRLNYIVGKDGKKSILIAGHTPAERDLLQKRVQAALSNLEQYQVFAVPLAQLVDADHPVPLFVETLLKRLDSSVKTPGLFRISGSADTINAIQRSIDRGLPMDFAMLDEHVVSGLLKLWLRLLPDPLIPFELFPHFVEAEHADAPVFKALVSKLPPTNLAVLHRIVSFLVKVSTFSEQNKMTASNLGIVIGPNVLREPKDSFFSNAGPIFEKLIVHYDVVFPKEQARFTKAQPKPSRLLRVRAQQAGASLTSRGLMGARDGTPTKGAEPDSPSPDLSSSVSSEEGPSFFRARRTGPPVRQFLGGERRAPESPASETEDAERTSGARSTLYAPNPAALSAVGTGPAPPPRKRPAPPPIAPLPPVAPLPPLSPDVGSAPAAPVRVPSQPQISAPPPLDHSDPSRPPPPLPGGGGASISASASAPATASGVAIPPPPRRRQSGTPSSLSASPSPVAAPTVIPPPLAADAAAPKFSPVRGRGRGAPPGRGRGAPPGARGGAGGASPAKVGPPPPLTVGPPPPPGGGGGGPPVLPPRDHVCAGCEQPLVPNTGIKVLGQSYHVQCFACSDCGNAFGNFIEHNGKAYCPADFQAKFGSATCSACQQGVSAAEGFVSVGEQHWHTACFTCSACSSPLEANYFLNDNGEPLCGSCYQ